jgi:hypothetical protein
LSHWEANLGQEKDNILIARGDTWKYLESWGTPAWDWTTLSFNDGYWSTGKAELGYGDGDETTIIGYGGDSQNKMITAWFRKKFTIGDKSAFTRYTLHLLRDDGVRLYLNGMEVIRDNMDRWSVGSYSPAIADVSGADETFYNTYQLNPALFNAGENVIAAEIHQSSGTSPDLSFDMDLLATSLESGSSYISNDQELLLNLSDNTAVTAYIIPDTNRIEAISINEVMAKNSSGYTDDQGEYEDWIELYNKGSVPVDLSGLYLSDTLSVADAWQIPSGNPELTTIMPEDYMVFIADNEPSEGLLHTSFKLDKDGDEVVLFQAVGNEMNIIDQLQFGIQNADISWGRYPDGSSTLEFMPVSTPWAANIWEPTDIASKNVPAQVEDVSIYPVPSDGHLFVWFTDQLRSAGVPVRIDVYSSTGRLIATTNHHSSEIIELSLENQPRGLYLLKIITESKVFNRRVVLY